VHCGRCAHTRVWVSLMHARASQEISGGFVTACVQCTPLLVALHARLCSEVHTARDASGREFERKSLLAPHLMLSVSSDTGQTPQYFRALPCQQVCLRCVGACVRDVCV
jgi:hypothetical protein